MPVRVIGSAAPLYLPICSTSNCEAQLVQQPLVEGHFGPDAGHDQHAGGRHEDFVAGRGHQVLAGVGAGRARRTTGLPALRMPGRWPRGARAPCPRPSSRSSIRSQTAGTALSAAASSIRSMSRGQRGLQVAEHARRRGAFRIVAVERETARRSPSFQRAFSRRAFSPRLFSPPVSSRPIFSRRAYPRGASSPRLWSADRRVLFSRHPPAPLFRPTWCRTTYRPTAWHRTTWPTPRWPRWFLLRPRGPESASNSTSRLSR